MISPTSSWTRTNRLHITAHAVLLGVLCIFAALAVTSSNPAGAATAQPGIGILRYGNTYEEASGYERYAYVLVGQRDGAAAGALPVTSLQYMSGPAVQTGYLTGVSYQDALANGWLLTNASGQHIRTPFGAYLADIGNPGYQQRWLENVIPILASQGNEGVFIDDVVSTADGWGSMPTKYPTHQAWENAMVAFVAAVGPVVRSRGYYVLANSASAIPNDPNTSTGENFSRFNERLAPYVSGLMDEYWMQAPEVSDSPFKLRSSGTSEWTQHWDTWLDVLTRTQRAGADFFTVMYGSTSSVNTMRYGKASFLLEWDGSGGAFMYEASGDPWNPEWTMDIGRPSGARYQVGVGWRREYTGGTVVLNSSPTASQTFALGGTYTRADGTAVTSVTLSPTSALVLKGSSAPPPPPPPPPPPSPPANTGLPVITGTAQQGATLSSSTGSWSNSPTAYAYQWERCDTTGANCAPVAGSTGQQHTLGAVAVGKTMRVTVTASNAAGSASATSNPTGVVSAAPPPPPPPAPPANTGLPVVTGTPQEGATLSSSTGSWSNSPTAYAYQWKRCDTTGANCAPVAGSTGQQHALGAGDVGKTMRVTVTASNAAGSASATSSATGLIAPAPAAKSPKISVRPTLSGTPRDGLTLTSTAGTWSNSPRYHSFQWRRCNAAGGGCVNIGGATDMRYVVKAADVGQTLRVVVAASNDAGVSYARTDETARVAPRAQSAPEVLERPTTSGTPREGAVLTVSTGSWANDPKHYAFQWRRCPASGGACASIENAVDSEYPVGAADVGWTLRVVVAASNDAGTSYARTDATAIVSPSPVSAPPGGRDK